ncbi:MAG: DNA sulfur modification protein DndD [bacterium]
MTFDSIVLENFGVYGGRQEIVLLPDKANKPIILFGGMNGGGKTTLLDAVQLAFYGAKARCSNRGKLSYRDFLRQAIHRGADPAEGASIEIRFNRSVDGEMKFYNVIRSWRETGKGVEDHLEVTCDGEPDTLLAEHWDEYIESYIPSGIAHLFFFDAEQIKELADGDHAAEILGTAIHSLLGLDLVERLGTDLLALERRKRAEGKTGEEARNLKETEEDAIRMLQLLDDATQQKGHLEIEAEQIVKKINECIDKFKKEGGELFQRRKELETEQHRLKKEIAEKEMLLRDLAAGAAPLLLVTDLLEQTEKQARREIEERKFEVLLGALEERDRSVMEILRRDKMPPGYLSRIEAVLREDREQLQGLVAEPCFLDADDHLAAELRHLRTGILPEVAERIRSELVLMKKLREQLTRIETQLAQVPAGDAIAARLQELERLQKQHLQKLAEFSAQEAKVDVLRKQAQAAKAAHERELGKNVDQQETREDQERILKYAAKVRGTLEQFRAATIRKHAKKIERLMLECFTQLLRKTNLVTGLKIDPETYRIELTGGDGKLLAMDRLSAGERQLLATALLWGLARASGRPLPTIIDTPLGRLDSSHRRHLIERYFPVASHQVILLSTDEEINSTHLDRLKPAIGRMYQLQFDDKTRSTIIKPGYFPNHETTR